jgi:hypothetical protein
MSWVNDLASGLGIPAGAATVAVGMFTACTAAETAARPEALHEIGRALKADSWERSARPSAIIERIFIWTFGERHLGWKCARRSALASVIFVITASLFYREQAGVLISTSATEISEKWKPLFESEPLWEVVVGLAAAVVVLFGMWLIISAIPDYLSLWKTRLIMRRISGRSASATIALLVMDLLVSLALALIAITLFAEFITIVSWTRSFSWNASEPVIANLIQYWRLLEGPMLKTAGQTVPIVLHDTIKMFHGGPFFFFPLCALSTVFTSVWTILVLLASVALKLLSPIQHLTAWFFDVDKRPLQAIGIVSGALVMLGAGLWSLVRWLV